MIIAQMVGRNESSRFLKEVMEHNNEFVDMTVFTDDCSDDNTPDIAADMGASVFQMDEPTFIHNEGALRQKAWENLEQFATPGDWILAIDCDEKFYPGSHESLHNWTTQGRYKVLSVTFYHMWDKDHYRVDKAWRPTQSTRMFKYFEGGGYRQRKLACGAEPHYVSRFVQEGSFARHTGFVMQHLGYVRDEDKQAKYERYMDLDGGDFHSLKHIESIMDENPRLIDWNF